MFRVVIQFENTGIEEHNTPDDSRKAWRTQPRGPLIVCVPSPQRPSRKRHSLLMSLPEGYF